MVEKWPWILDILLLSKVKNRTNICFFKVKFVTLPRVI